MLGVCDVQGGTVRWRSSVSLVAIETRMRFECNLTEMEEKDTTDNEACEYFDSGDDLNEACCGCEVDSGNAIWCYVHGGTAC